MNKKYIDFVPTKNGATGQVGGGVSRVRTTTVRTSAAMTSGDVTMRGDMVGGDVTMRGGVVTQKNSTTKRKGGVTKRAVVNRRVRNSNVYRAMPDNGRDDLLGVITELDPVENPVEKSVGELADMAEKPSRKRSVTASKDDQRGKYQIPKSPFINQVNVAKRPLSKNVYQKKVEPTKEPKAGPVAIISKPEKDSRAGLVVGIILTIILGAAAGTIAFLLLPK